MTDLVEKTYGELLVEVKERIKAAQYSALKAVNREMISLYWDIGKTIVERQQDESWGKSVVKQLSEDLRQEFPEHRGFSSQNLWFMRQFYLEYKDNEKLQPMVREIVSQLPKELRGQLPTAEQIDSFLEGLAHKKN